MTITVKKKQQGEDHGKDTQEEPLTPEISYISDITVPEVSYISDMMSCPICYSDFPTSSMVMLLCNHRFCYSCISRWIETKIEGSSFGNIGIDCPSGTCG